jgi:hypothetical protein
VLKEIDAVYPDAYALYLDLHQNPELSSHEIQTAAKLGTRFHTLGYTVTEHVGGNGIVAILKNGPGPTVMPCSARNSTRSLWNKRQDFLTRARFAPKTIQGTKSRWHKLAVTTCIWKRC